MIVVIELTLLPGENAEVTTKEFGGSQRRDAATFGGVGAHWRAKCEAEARQSFQELLKNRALIVVKDQTIKAARTGC